MRIQGTFVLNTPFSFGLASIMLVFCLAPSCVGHSRYPDGYTPRPWLLVLDRGSFLAYRLPLSEIGSNRDGIEVLGFFNSRGRIDPSVLQTLPLGTTWESISNLDEFTARNLCETGTVVLIVRVREKLEDEVIRASQVLGSQGVFYSGIQPSLEAIVRNGDHAEEFLANLPERRMTIPED